MSDTDIVKRLRRMVRGGMPCLHWVDPDTLTDAADEIERLRVVVRVLKLGINGLIDSHDAIDIAIHLEQNEPLPQQLKNEVQKHVD